MTSLEKLTRIQFPHSIVAAEARDLLGHVAVQLKCSVNYKEELSHRLDSDESGKVSDEQEVVRIEGGFHSPQVGLVSFTLKRQIRDNNSRYSGLDFFTAPGYDLGEINPAERKFMEDARTAISQYFDGIKQT